MGLRRVGGLAGFDLVLFTCRSPDGSAAVVRLAVERFPPRIPLGVPPSARARFSRRRRIASGFSPPGPIGFLVLYFAIYLPFLLRLPVAFHPCLLAFLALALA